MVPMRAQSEWRLSMNLAPSSHPSPPVGEKVPGGRLRGIRNGSWSQCVSKRNGGLNHAFVAAEVTRRINCW